MPIASLTFYTNSRHYSSSATAVTGCGVIVPVNRLKLLALWLGLAALMAMAVVAVVVRRRRG